jgi:hypothetical protein
MEARGMAVAAFVAIALAAGGCGGSSAKPLTRAELTAKANAICRTVSAKLATNTIKNAQEMARTAPKLASFEQNALSELSRLVPPAALESDWQAFIAGAQKLAENTAKLGEYAKTKNLRAAGALIAMSENIQQRMLKIVKRDGIRDCEQVP